MPNGRGALRGDGRARVPARRGQPRESAGGGPAARERGWRVDVAGQGREALALVRYLPYDVILMDCRMPEMDGYEFDESHPRASRARRSGRQSSP